jgi:hypothetical protein
VQQPVNFKLVINLKTPCRLRYVCIKRSYARDTPLVVRAEREKTRQMRMSEIRRGHGFWKMSRWLMKPAGLKIGWPH